MGPPLGLQEDTIGSDATLQTKGGQAVINKSSHDKFIDRRLLFTAHASHCKRRSQLERQRDQQPHVHSSALSTKPVFIASRSPQRLTTKK